MKLFTIQYKNGSGGNFIMSESEEADINGETWLVGKSVEPQPAGAPVYADVKINIDPANLNWIVQRDATPAESSQILGMTSAGGNAPISVPKAD